MKKKIVFAITLILILAVGGVAVNFAFGQMRAAALELERQDALTKESNKKQAMAAETLSWPVFQNNGQGFSFRYPGGFSINERKLAPTSNILYSAVMSEAGKGQCVEYRIEASGAVYQDIGSWADVIKKSISLPTEYAGKMIAGRKVLSEADVAIGGVAGKKIISEGGPLFWNGYFGIIKDGKIYNIYYRDLTGVESQKLMCPAAAGEEGKYSRLFDQVVSTFRFIKPGAAVPD